MSLLWLFGAIYSNHQLQNTSQADANSVQPSVEIFMSCFNEAKILERSVDYLEKLNYNNYKLILINDKSTDNTLEIMQQLAQTYSNIIILALKTNHGKANAMNVALKHCQSDYILCVDADSLIDPDALLYLTQTITADPKIAAVTGRPLVHNVSSIIGKLQYMEYALNIDFIKRSQSFFVNKINTVSGVLTIYDVLALRELGGWSSEAMTEDIDATWQFYDHHRSCGYDPRALCHIYVPESIRGFIKQRIRWARGSAEVLKKHFSLIPRMRGGQRFLALDMIVSDLWIVSVLYSFVSISFMAVSLKNLFFNINIIIIYFILTLIFYITSKVINRNNPKIKFPPYCALYIVIFFYAYWLNNIVITISALYHINDTVKFAAWGSSDRGKIN
ncbi:glycosyltransferase [Lactobacillus sp. DCY120]|uniref:Glycosyltransferase n=2 Tax=Bombilactobacillus apium TaxID=2675299 RepID=A0A850R1R4_9LACO|nr:glycosyltransferase [Bombilactobacillus apium]